MEQTKQSQINKVSPATRMWAIAIIGIIVGWGGYYLWDNRDVVRGEGKTPIVEGDEKNTTENNIPETPTMPEGISVTIGEQPEGMHVFANTVTNDRTIWIAVREDNKGALGNILGAALLHAGVYDGVWVELLRNTFGGQTYHIVIYEDDGDKVFDYTKDVMLPGTNGDGIVATFGAIRI